MKDAVFRLRVQGTGSNDRITVRKKGKKSARFRILENSGEFTLKHGPECGEIGATIHRPHLRPMVKTGWASDLQNFEVACEMKR